MANQEAKIPLGLLVPQREMRGAEDDWSGVTSSADRRRVQNRLNQRVWRMRHKLNRWHKDINAEATHSATIESSLRTCLSDHKPQPIELTNNQYHGLQVQGFHLGFNSTSDIKLGRHSGPEWYPACIYLSRRRTSMCDLSDEEMKEIENYFMKQANRHYLSKSLMNDQLLPLIQFNVFRAMLTNIRLLGLTLERICDEDYVSPFNGSQPDQVDISFLPSSLRPTSLQRRVAHHPWLDFFPFPTVRDNLIRAGDTFDDEQLCIDLMGFCNAPSEKTGLIIWGEPWNPQGWEVTESFVRNWAWVITGCTELMVSTNHWRAQRGDKLLFLL
ncbi:hypothetical protein V501_00559 [Pseudogymnoascus sp. VKM F-4519 (FW-2642)]|nr:hypothetical protein V501_00559 [Pseudogymnoascus sp. VKM F-4519 (FW-2642)]